MKKMAGITEIYSVTRNNLLIQVYKRSGTSHRFVAVELQILIVSEKIYPFRDEPPGIVYYRTGGSNPPSSPLIQVVFVFATSETYDN